MCETVCSVQEQVCCIKGASVLHNCQLKCKAALLFKVWLHVFKGIVSKTSSCVSLVLACVYSVQAIGKNCNKRLAESW